MDEQEVCTPSDQAEFWKKKRADKRKRKKERNEVVKSQRQEEWAGMTEEERQARREEALRLRALRKDEEEAEEAKCRAALDSVKTPTVVFDLSFAWCMTVADTKSTVAQIKYAYSSLKHSQFPFKPVITSVKGKEEDSTEDTEEQEKVLEVLRDFEGFKRYPPVVTEEHWSKHFDKSKVVFLTADSDDTLTEIEPEMVYVIGAFVDHNRHKNLSFQAASRHGVRTAKLPIQENITIGDRCKVLTINHMVDVLAKYQKEKDWRSALETVLPSRRTKEKRPRGK
ncbi:tRNA (guanine-N(1)-)-methyltransferase TRM10 [Angomonas deanei]|nr:tRNA (guanine-N(1)-)-methyltransferase TRM10 [Angomonas deanei]|eukprot:EPY22523.1 tRNA (guanine-N(1)-)-methyltransferase TRM10 [Angomonas deanei]